MAAVDGVHQNSGNNSQDSKESGGQRSMLELLMVTDAAVKALNKSMRSQSSTSSVGSKKSDLVDPLTQSLHSDRSVHSAGSGRSAGSAHSGKSIQSGRSEHSTRSYHSGQSLRSQQSVQSRDDNGEEQMSKREVSHDSGVVSKTQSTSVEKNKARETTARQDEASSDVSTTASDILIQSTHERSERSLLGNPVNGNSSTSSRCSKASFGLENFNSTGPQKVKISKKRLKEIKSPFDDESPRDSVSSDEKVPSSLLGRKSRSSVSSGGSQHSLTNGGPAGRKVLPRDNVEKTSVNGKKTTSGAKQFPKDIDMEQFEIEKVRKSTEKAYEDVNLARNKNNSALTGNSASDDKKDKEGRKVVTKERRLENKGAINGVLADPENDPSKPYRSTPKYFVQRHTPQKSIPKTDTKPEIPERKNLLQDLEESVEIITAHAQDTSSRSSQPEIVTVPERIVTISSKVSLSPSSSAGDVSAATKVAPPLVSYHSADHRLRDDKGHMEEKKNLDDSTTIPPALTRQHLDSDGEKESRGQAFPSRSQWFSKQVHGYGLQQGAPVNGPDAPDKREDVEIEVSDFKLTAKQRLARESFAKRQGGPVRRVVQPRLVGHDSKASSTSSTGELKPRQQQLSQSNDQVLTAAAAASAAVAATQPFLKAQYEMEAKMAEVLDKISELQSGKVKTSSEAESGRVKQLEQQLADMTEKRIDYMEKLQEQQMAMQAKLLSLTRDQPSSRPVYHARSYSPVFHQPSVPQVTPNPTKAFSKTTVGYPQTKGDNSNVTRHSVEADEFVSPLDTPAPRARAPKPTTYDTSNIQYHPRSRSPKSRSPKARSPKARSPKARSRSPYKEKRDQGILHQILASAEFPVRDPGPNRPRSPVLQTRYKQIRIYTTCRYPAHSSSINETRHAKGGTRTLQIV